MPSSCCSSSSPSPSVCPFRGRFHGIRTHIIAESIKIIKHQVELAANRVKKNGQCQCRTCTEELCCMVKAAEDARLCVDKETYKSMLEVERVKGQKEVLIESGVRVKRGRREERKRKFEKKKRALSAYMKEFEKQDDEEESSVLDIYD